MAVSRTELQVLAEKLQTIHTQDGLPLLSDGRPPQDHEVGT